MTAPSRRTTVLASVGVASLLAVGGIASRGPAVEYEPDGGLVASGSGGTADYSEKDAAPKKARRHRFHQPHELPEESLPAPPDRPPGGDQHD